MNTLRAPELAAGALQDVLRKVSADGFTSLVKDTCVTFPASQWASITCKGMFAACYIGMRELQWIVLPLAQETGMPCMKRNNKLSCH